VAINLSLDSRFVNPHLEPVISKIRSRTVETQPQSPHIFHFSPNNVASLSVLTNFSVHSFDKLMLLSRAL